MRMFSALLGMGLLGAASLLSACEGDSTNNDSGGAGGAGGAGPTIQACYDYCDALEANSCPDASDTCMKRCDGFIDLYTAECEDELGAAYACLLPFASTCADDQGACKDAWDTFETCGGMHGCLILGSDSCPGDVDMNGDVNCGCGNLCFNKTYETDCSAPAGGTMTCKCLVDGVEVGTCDEGEQQSCKSATRGCCQAEYFKIPPPWGF
ncbi:hypothetical protein [Polyangium sp. 6x1]|uniref:hypothetical protein n=1 Tax=Polyangium sp. 6x1 TaxID=3042689 RepID=UPI002482F425|nr:hypothetical protein [Polyangium sp. 6x1]MDI1446166.1 hypothetical protein [Polyangium sp. 6x1]